MDSLRSSSPDYEQLPIDGRHRGSLDSVRSSTPPKVRQTSIRLSTGQAPGTRSTQQQANRSRLPTTTATAGSSANKMVTITHSNRSSARARRPTPIVRRRRNAATSTSSKVAGSGINQQQLIGENDDYEAVHSEEGEFDNEDDDDDDNLIYSSSSSSGEQQQQQAASSSGQRRRIQRRLVADNARGSQISIKRSSVTTRSPPKKSPSELNWYERLVPEFVLNMTAPITGYEQRVDSDIEDKDAIEILERSRLRRNRRVRRRLLTLVLIATAASLIMYTRGRFFRRMGVKAAVSIMKHRLEDGFARSIHETMGK